MALFSTTIKRASVSLTSYPFHSHVPTYLSAILPVSKHVFFSTSVSKFFVIFLFALILVMLLLAALIILSLLFLILFKFLDYLPTPPLGQDMTQGQFLSGV